MSLLGNIDITHSRRLIFGGVVIFWYIRRWLIRGDLGIQTVFDEEIDAVSVRRSWKRYMKHILKMMTIFLFFVILSQPVLLEDTQEITRDGIDIAIVLDISSSMNTPDLEPDRLTVAKSTIIDFIKDIRSDRVGVVVFKGVPFTSVPLTFDYDFVRDAINDTTNSTIDGLGGTAIGDAIMMGTTLLTSDEDSNDTSEREKIMILVSDGAPSAGTLDPMIAAGYALEAGVSIYTIGIGDPKGTVITIDTPFGPQQQVVPGIDEKILQEISLTTHAGYRNATDTQTLQKIFTELNKLTTSEIIIGQVKIHKPLRKNLLLLLTGLFFACLLIEVLRY